MVEVRPARGIRPAAYWEDGSYWFDRSGLLSAFMETCFMCGELTDRVDIDYNAPFCDSAECNLAITNELRRLSE